MAIVNISSHSASVLFTQSSQLDSGINTLESWPYDPDDGYDYDRTALAEGFARMALSYIPPVGEYGGQIIRIVRPILPKPRRTTKGRPRDGY